MLHDPDVSFRGFCTKKYARGIFLGISDPLQRKFVKAYFFHLDFWLLNLNNLLIQKLIFDKVKDIRY